MLKLRLAAAALACSVLSCAPTAAQQGSPDVKIYTFGLHLQKVIESCDISTTGKQRGDLSTKLLSLQGSVPPAQSKALMDRVAAESECPKTPKDQEEYKQMLSAFLDKSPSEFVSFMNAKSGAQNGQGQTGQSAADADALGNRSAYYYTGLILKDTIERCNLPTTGAQRRSVEQKTSEVRSTLPDGAVTKIEAQVKSENDSSDCPTDKKNLDELSEVLTAFLENKPDQFSAVLAAKSSNPPAPAVPAPASPAAAPTPAAPNQQSELLKAVTVDAVAGELRERGYKAEVIRKPNERPLVRTAMGGQWVSIHFTYCKEENCGAYQFYTYFPKSPKITFQTANLWNSRNLFSRAYLDKDGDFVLQWDIDISGGVGSGFVKETIGDFEKMLADFQKALP